MEITKPNDIFVATLNNPEATPYELLSNNINGDNTSLFPKEEYKQSEYIQNQFKDKDGKFDDNAFEAAYKLAESKYYNLTNDEYLKELDTMAYSPFDITRPKEAKTFNVSAVMEKDYNPFKTLKGWTGFNSLDQNKLSTREIIQQNKVYDPETDTWSKESLNDMSLWDKLVGDTFVYAQYDEDGVHKDPESGLLVNHKKGDYKIDPNGQFYSERLGNREIYGRQVVNPLDVLTTEGSLMDQYNFLDSDGREKSITGTVFKMGAEIAPVFIPGVSTYYIGLKTAVGLASVLPTFYKSIEGALFGDQETSLTAPATKLEGWLSKYTQNSVSDEGGDSLFSPEQMGSMISDIFTQVYEQRAAASLSKMLIRGDNLMDDAAKEMAAKINRELLTNAMEGKIDINDVSKLSKLAMAKIPSLQSALEKQSQLSKALSLGYMALTSTADVYGEALQGGYDRRTAGIAALAAIGGQYAIMMNNRMGDWFLDKTTGYNAETNRALVNEAVTPWFEEFSKGISTMRTNKEVGKKMLKETFGKVKQSITDTFTSPSVLRESMWKNAMIEGVEEVTEQMVLDATKGMTDALSYFGITKKQGSFGGFNNVFSAKGLENYMANLVGGVIGGGLFELHRSVIEPYFNPDMFTPETKKSLYELIAGGHKEEVIKVINQNKYKLANKYITVPTEDGTIKAADTGNSQADLIASRMIDTINIIDGILNIHNLGQSDEDIVRKTLRDELIIQNLKKATVEGSNIGLEGLILEDYKTRMSAIVDLEAHIKNLGDSDDNKETVKALKEKVREHANVISDMMEGKLAAKYFRQATWYLSREMHAPFLNIDKISYTKGKYNLDYSSLPKTGLGLTQESLDKEWKDYIDNKNLRKDLEVADGIYVELEKQLNPSIADYVTSGYAKEHLETLKNILDLDKTIKLFNTNVSEQEKEKAFNHFIELNNNLSKEGIGLISPWTVVNNDMFEQLSNLGLIKKVNYSTDEEGNISENVGDFSEAELSSKIGDTEATTNDLNKNYIQNYFKTMPLNPLEAEKSINNFNNEIYKHNSKIVSQINSLENKEDITPEEEEKIKTLKGTLINLKIGSIYETPILKGLIQSASDQINGILAENGITAEELDNYIRLQKVKGKYSQSFEDLLSEFGVEDWKNLDKEGLTNFINNLKDSGIYTTVMSEIAQVSNNVDNVINTEETKLHADSLTPEQLEDIKNNLEEFMNTIKNKLNENHNILNDDKYRQTLAEKTKIEESLKNDVNNSKPQLFKLRNYAFDLLLTALENGSADKEVFNEAEKLYNEELVGLVSAAFPNSKNLDFATYTNIINVLPKVLSDIEDATSDEEFGEFTTSDSLEEVFAKLDESYEKDPNFTSMFQDKNTYNFIKDNFDKTLLLSTFTKSIKNSLEVSKSNILAFNNINKFLEIQKKVDSLKTNSIYDFIKKFTLTLNSNPNNKTTKIFDILKREELTLKSASNITNFLSDGVRESDINQAINTLDMISSVIHAMSTTEVGYDDPIGFVSARQKFSKEYNLEDEVENLFTISSDMAALMMKDVEAIKTKLLFLKEFTKFNAGKMMNEQEIIRTQVENVLLDNWKSWSGKFNPSFAPIDKIKSILNSTSNNSKKLMDIENAIFEHNISNKEEALQNFLKEFERIDSEEISQIDKNVKAFTNWDLATYLATVLSSKAEDFHIRSLITLNGDFQKAPFYTQEFNARIVRASTIHPELFASIFNTVKNPFKANVDFITVVTGNAGTGKTTAVFGLDLDQFRQTNPATNVWLVGPTDTQTDNLEKGIIGSVGKDKISYDKHNKQKLFETLGISDLVSKIETELATINEKSGEYVKLVGDRIVLTEAITNNEWINSIYSNLEKLPNLLLIDEVTHFSFAELYLLNAISKKSFQDENLSFMKIIAAGDPTQLGYMVQIGDSYYEYNVGAINSIFTPKLWASVRASNAQSRLNNEILIRITSEIESIFRKNNKDDSLGGLQAFQNSQKQSATYLENTKELNVLSYYEDENKIEGSKVIKSLDAQTVRILSNIVKQNPEAKIGILVDREGETNIPEEWRKLLSDAGLITPEGMPNIITFTPKNIQGSEIDYFIFDSKHIEKYDKLRDNLKALYTFMSRSKNSTIVVDSSDILKSKYSISNDRASYSSTFDPLTKEVIEKAKETKIANLKELLGENPTPSEHDNFKWKVGNSEIEEPVLQSWYVGPLSEKVQVETTNEQISKGDTSTPTDFKIMLHSFYNNPGTVVEDNGTINVNNDNPKFDLNLNYKVDSENSEKVIQDWTKLKNFLLFNRETQYIRSSDYKNFLGKAFAGLENSTDNIPVEIILTATKFNRDINTPYKKKGFDETKVLTNGTPFINLTAKLTYNGATHYITLATFGTLEEISAKALKLQVPTDNIVKKYEEISTGLDTNKVIEYKISNSSINVITSTLLNKALKGNYSLISLKEEFPGMNFSEIRLYPGNYTAFKNLINKYTFGTPRTEEQIKRLFEGYTDSNNNFIPGLKNKPYIVVSYNNDLDGGTGNVQAALIPIGANSRGLNTLIKEATELLKERREELFSSKGLSDELKAKSEVLLHRSDILDILIKWGTESYGDGTLLDLLFKEIDFSINDQISGTKTSIFDIFNRFLNNKVTTVEEKALGKEVNKGSFSTDNLKTIILKLQEQLKKNPSSNDLKTIKKDLLKQMEGIKGWQYSFFNIFAYSEIIKNASDRELSKMILQGIVDEKHLDNNEGIKKMTEAIESLMKPIAKNKFYYSVPIKPGEFKGSLIVNKFISGIDGFTTDFYGDKFYINIAPESPRLLINVEDFLSATPKTTTEEAQKQKEPTEPEVNNTEDDLKKLQRQVQNDYEDLLVIGEQLKKAKVKDMIIKSLPKKGKELSALIDLFPVNDNIINVINTESFKDPDLPDSVKVESVIQTLGLSSDLKNNSKKNRDTINALVNGDKTKFLELSKQITDLIKKCN